MPTVKVMFNGVDITDMLVDVDPQAFRARMVSSAEAIAATHASMRPADSLPIDMCPDDCWRCDAAPSDDELGLCVTCRVDLT